METEEIFNENNIHDIYPLSSTQEGMLFYSIDSPDTGMYVQQMIYDLNGIIDIPVFKKAWERVIRRHESLRTSFFWEDISKPMQIVYKHIDLPWEVIDMSNMDTIKRKKNVYSFLKKDLVRGFDISNPPLMRFCIIKEDNNNNNKFIWSFHHLLLDGWSVALILKEVISIYRSLLCDTNLQLEKASQYKDYIKWIKEQDIPKAQKYWRDLLNGLSEPTNLEVGLVSDGKVEKSHKNSIYGIKEVFVSEDITNKLNHFAKNNNFTMNSLFQGIWSILLSTYSRKRDIVYGTVVSGRTGTPKYFDKMVGMLINTLPVRISIKDDENFISFVERLQEQLIELRQYEYMPLVNIGKNINITSGNALFESIFVYENYPFEIEDNEKIAEGLHLKKASSVDSTNYPLSIVVYPNKKMRIKVLFHKTRFSEAVIASILDQFTNLLTQLDQTKLVGEFEVITAKGKNEILNVFNNTTTDYPRNSSIPKLFEEQVTDDPNAVALSFGDVELSYSQVNSMANNIFADLKQHGIKKGARVALLTGRSIETVVGMIAVLKAGAVYVPLDSEYPAERIKMIIEDSGIEILFKKDDVDIDNLDFAGKVYDLNHKNMVSLKYSTENATVDASDLCYIMYTSGSTGKPKGVLVNHRNVIRLVKNTRYINFDKNTKMLMTGSVVFDATTLEIWGTLLNGGHLNIIHEDQLLDNEKLKKIIRASSINTMFLSTPVLHQIAQQDCKTFKGVDTLLTGGDVLSTQFTNKIIEENPDLVIINGYGPTENTTYSTTYSINKKHEGPIPIGVPISNSKAYVVDENLRLLPIGVAGELLVAGDGVADGYLNREDLTAEKFINSPFHAQEKCYRTGDIVRLRNDGVIEYIGRTDDQIKIRGNRVELSEVSRRLCEHELIEDAIAILTTSLSGTKEICVYYIPSNDSFTKEYLKVYLANCLPGFMIPSHYISLDSFPLNTNGKVDRKALPKPYTSNLNTETIYEEPTTNRERVLTEIWEEVLSRKKVGITDNFFEIGGDSILAIRLIAKAKEQGLNFTPKDLFHHRTIANLVSVVREVEDNEEQGLIEGNVPLTPVQQWFFETMLEEPNHFNQSLFLQVRDEIDPVLLKKSFDYLIEYHDALRSRFSLSEEGWKQENVGLDGELQEFKVIDLADHSSELQKKEMERIANRAQQELSIEKGPLVNVRYFNLGRKQPNRILIIIHHLVVDGVSWRILLDDLHKIYQDLKNQEEPKLPSKTMSYKKWAEKLLEYVDSDKIQKEKAYWLDVISKGSTPLAIDYQGENTVASTDNVSVELNQAYTASLLQEVPKTYHTQIQEILLMVLGETFSEWIGRTPLLIDVEGHGREQFDDEVDCSRTVGWFTSIYPVQIGLRNKNDIGEGIKQVKEGIRKIPNGGIDYGVLKYLGSNEIPSANSEVSFNYLGQFDQALTEAALFKMAHESVGLEQSQDNNRPYVLEISGKIMDETLQLNWRYSKNLHERRTISKLANEYMDKLREVINHCLTSSMEYTPSDFPEAKLNQEELNDIINISN